jgi:hypothetical protein
MKSFIKHKSTRIIIFLSVLFFCCSDTASAQSGFEIYFFGQKISSIQNDNWLKVTVGAVASLCIHELGHVLYLESIGKSWNLNASISSGFSIQTDENLTDAEWANFGRAGFALQSLVGTTLTLFEKTRHWDLTKGWVAMNTVQIFSYQGRHNQNDGDFALIERGGGARDLEFTAFSLLSINSLLRLENDVFPLMPKPKAAPDFNLSYNFSEFEGDSKDELVTYTDSRLSLHITSALELPSFDPQKSTIENSSWNINPKFADLN